VVGNAVADVGEPLFDLPIDHRLVVDDLVSGWRLVGGHGSSSVVVVVVPTAEIESAYYVAALASTA
jgi:hypothetical protein